MTDPVLPSLGADIEQRLKALEVAAVAKEHALVAKLKANFPHFVTWAGIAYAMFSKKLGL
jgi:hypothetical protein